jgi:hypothetical protein
MNQRKLNIIKWIARIFSLLILIVGVPLYCGYGNPLPFASSEYNFFDNLWRAVFPLMFVGLILGWKYEKIGGYLIIIGILTRFIVSIIVEEGISPHLVIPLIVGILYLIVGYKKQN